ncbi:MAG: aromatic ring-hydroxylating dioxygenase subunit alpha [Deltaproteobacteria bacterium]|nr:aromatic ring-hydroxylating dioxygenase subunit alpha [Deltaproteobacteria bacterium]
MANVLSQTNEWSELVQAGPRTPMGMLLRKFWQPVAVSSELKVGKAMPIRIMNEDLTLYRGESGKPHIVADRCAHRLTLLYTGWVEQECIRCRYHGWKYDGGGQCVEMPAEDATFASKVKILSYPAREYAGLVFAFMGQGEPPEFAHKAEIDRNYGIKWALSMIWPCNWFQRIENSMDAVHVSFVHQESRFGQSLSYTVPSLSYEETEWGIRQIATRAANNVRISEFNWPNCNHIVTPTQFKPQGETKLFPWTDLFNWFVPVDDGHTALFSVRSSPIRGDVAQESQAWLFSRDKYNPAEYDEELFKGVMPDNDAGQAGNALVNAQDYIVQVGQGAIVDRSQERLGKSDAGVILLRKIFHRELDAIKKGLPGKAWKPRKGFARLPVPPNVPASPDPETAMVFG